MPIIYNLNREYIVKNMEKKDRNYGTSNLRKLVHQKHSKNAKKMNEEKKLIYSFDTTTFFDSRTLIFYPCQVFVSCTDVPRCKSWIMDLHEQKKTKHCQKIGICFLVLNGLS